jgi:GNAT superfamily N-acetyltransferase
MSQDITTYFLEIMSIEKLRARSTEDSKFRVSECIVKQYQYNRFLYEFIGRKWQWKDKLSDNDEKWKTYVNDTDLRTWIANYEGSIAGYYELQKQSNDGVQICYLGLAEDFIGKGFGAALLTHAIRCGFGWGAKRVWVHTCTLDHKNALANYIARGMNIYKTEIKKDSSS